MKTRLFILAGLLGGIAASAQVPNPSIVSVGAAPSGVCDQVLPLYIAGESAPWFCDAGTWTQLGSASGGDSITSPNSTITIGGGPTATTIDLNLAHANTWTAAQTGIFVLSGVTPSTSPICPNGSGGALTTTGCTGGGGSGITTLTPSVYGTASGTTGTLKTQRGVNAVVDWGLDNTGAADVGATINTKCAAYSTSNTQPEVYFPAGTYLVTTPIACTGSSTTVNNLSFIGEGRAARNGAGTVTFNCNTANSTCMWFDNSTTSTGNDKGPRLEHLTLIDTSSSKNDFALLRITQYNSIYVNDVSTQASVGTQYATGTVSISNGSTALTGAGTTFPAGIQFGHLQIGGNFQEVASQSSGTAATLTSNWQYTTAAGSAYAINYGGIGFLIEGTSAMGFTQYGTVVNYSGTGDRVCLDFGGGPTSSSGTSRIHFYGGFCNGNRVADSIGVFAGKFSDTHKIDVAINNVARGFISESAHALVFAGELENTGAFTVVSTCNGGVAAQSCTKGVVLNADATTTGHDTRILGGYIYTWGTGISVDSANVSTGQIDSVAMRGNATTNYSWSDASTGCSGTQTNAIVVQPDCDFFPSVLANNVATAGTTQGLAGLGVGTGTITLPGTFPTNYVGLIGPPTGTPAYFLQLPSASPSGGQVQSCASPSSVNGVSQSVCTWATPSTGTVTGSSLTSNAVIIGGGGTAISAISADTTVTHALFATAGAPAFRALAATDIPSTLSTGTTMLGAIIGTASEICVNGGTWPSCTPCTTSATLAATPNRQTIILTNGDTCALTFTQPGSGTINIQLRVVQSSSSSFNGTISGCKWPGGATPIITATTGATDFINVYLDGTNAYCIASQNFM